jgi:putative serine protease PepD
MGKGEIMPEENTSSTPSDASQSPTGSESTEPLATTSSTAEFKPVAHVVATDSMDRSSSMSPASVPKEPGKALPFVIGIIGVVVGALLVILIVWALGGFSSKTTSSSSTSDTTSSTASSTTIEVEGDSTTLAEAVAAKSMASVVSIKVYEETTTSSYYGYSLSSSGTSSSRSSGTSSSSSDDSDLEYVGLGSGVIITSDGYILTNYHVVEDGTVFVVYFDDDTSVKATLVASDSSSDIAVLKVDKTGLTPITVADSDDVVVGEWCASIGSPYGLEKSISTGIVSALYRSTAMDLSSSSSSSSSTYYYGTSSSSEYAYYANMIQTDASINPGNSGGALVNSNGELIGICTLIYSSSDSSSGVGCAIPANYALNIANQLIENGYAEHPVLGVTVDDVDATTVDDYDVAADYGAYVTAVTSGSVAASAGIEAGDVIVSYDGQKITTASGLLCAVKSTIVGDTVSIGIIRNGTSMTITATLDQVSSSS